MYQINKHYYNTTEVPFCFSRIVKTGNESDDEPKLLAKLFAFDIWLDEAFADEEPNEIMVVKRKINSGIRHKTKAIRTGNQIKVKV